MDNVLERVSFVKQILEDKKGKDVKVLKVDEKTTLCDYFIIASAGNITLVNSLSREVDDKLSEMGIYAKHIEGKSGGNWILMDYADFVVHIFHDEMREFYALERLWADADEVTL